MKKKTYAILTLILSLLCINKTYAACTQEEINEFKRIEDKYKVKYEIDKSTKKYHLYFERSKPNIYDYIIYTDEKIECEDINSTITKCSYFEAGEYELEILGQTETCKDSFKKITLNLPKYNKYSEDPLCQGIEEFVLCSPIYDKDIDYETFASRVETYKRTKKEKKEPNEERKQEENKIDVVLEYVKQNLFQIIIIIVFVVLLITTIIITAKSIGKSRRLE